MSEQGFTVRLSARIDGYLAAMEAAKKATKEVGDSGVNFDRLGGKMQDAGLTLTHAVTLPLIAVGGIAVKMASDYDASFARMEGLAGVQASEVDGLKKSVLGLAGETAQAPQKLADALYEASSAGLDTAGAMEAVKVAAKGAAVGMGSAQDIVGLVAAATASYGKENITAAQATDILTASIKAGRADPAELAGSLGRILPIASQLGISFDQVGGATAFLSNIMGNTAETVTALQGFFVQLLSPTEQGKQALLDMGTSVDELHASIDKDGLMGALDLLRSKGFGANQDALRNLFPDVQAFQGALALVNDTSGALSTTLDATKNSTGSLDTAFSLAADTGAFKMKQAWADIQVALIQAGDVILPIISGVAGAIGDLAEHFTDLPKPVQTIVVALLGLVAAAGPLLIIAGSMVKNFKLVKEAMTTMAAGATTAGLALGAVGLVMIAATAWYADNAAKKQRLIAITNDFTDALNAEKDGQKGAVDAAIAKGLSDKKLIEAGDALKLSTTDMAKIVRGESVPAYQKLQEVSEKYGFSQSQLVNIAATLGVSTESINGKTEELGRNFAIVNGVLAPLNDGLADAQEQMATSAQVAKDLASATTETDRETRKLVGTTADLVPPQKDAVLSAADLKAANDDLVASEEGIVKAQQDQFKAQQDVIDQARGAIDAQWAYTEAQQATKEAIQQATETLKDSKSTEDDKTDAVYAGVDAALRQGAAYVTMKGDQDNAKAANEDMITSLYGTATALAPDSPIRAAILAYIANLQGIPKDVHTTVTTAYVDTGAVGVHHDSYTPQSVIPQAAANNAGVIHSAGGRLVPGGSNVYSTLGEVAGSTGDEVVLPIGNMSALQSWLSDPRVGRPIAAAFGGGWSGSGKSMPTVNNNTVQFNGGINTPLDLKAAAQMANFYLMSAAA